MTKRATIRLPDELHARLTALAELRDATFNDVVTQYLADGERRDNGAEALKQAARSRIERIRREAGLDD